MPQIVEITGFPMGVDDGLEKVRLPAPVLVGSRIGTGATPDVPRPSTASSWS